MSEVLISARDIEKYYGHGGRRVHALRGVSIDVRRGELVMIVGPSGSGKTTLLQILGALLYPSAGTLDISGIRVDRLNAEELGRFRLQYVGFIFQFFNLLPTLKSWENVAVALDLRGWRRRTSETRSRQLLEEIGLSLRADFLPDELSGGERQRVAIARALANDPPIILADEPTAALDSDKGLQVARLLRRLANEEHRAVILVSHDTRLLPLADRVLAIEDGVLTTDAPR